MHSVAPPSPLDCSFGHIAPSDSLAHERSDVGIDLISEAVIQGTGVVHATTSLFTLVIYTMLWNRLRSYQGIQTVKGLAKPAIVTKPRNVLRSWCWCLPRSSSGSGHCRAFWRAIMPVWLLAFFVLRLTMRGAMAVLCCKRATVARWAVRTDMTAKTFMLLDVQFLVKFSALVVSALGLFVSPYFYAFHLIAWVPHINALVVILRVLRRRATLLATTLLAGFMSLYVGGGARQASM